MTDLLKQYVDPRLFVVALFIYFAIEFLKQTPALKKGAWITPLIAWLLGIVMSFLYLVYYHGEPVGGASAVVSIIQGTFAAALAVFSNQLLKQITIERVKQ